MQDTIRHAHNYLTKVKGGDYDVKDIDVLSGFLKSTKEKFESKKVALMFVSINYPYWQYALQVIEDAQKYFLPGHKTDFFLWSDMPQWTQEEIQKKIDALEEEQTGDKETIFFDLVTKYINALYLGANVDQTSVIQGMRRIGLEVQFLPPDESGQNHLMVNNIDEQTPNKIKEATRKFLLQYKNLRETCKIQEVEPVEWPYGTLMRYSMFLQQEEALKDYDYVFYMDVDMRIVNYVGDEILGQGLTIAPHPGYALRKELWPPYEPNPQSASYIKRPGKVIMLDGNPRFMPFYAAGGFQGGTSKSYIHAIKETKKLIDKDLTVNNYIPIWNDETAWNKFVFDCQTQAEIDQTIFLTPSYIYPDSLIKEYYEKFWGRSYTPRIITLTKPFTVQKIDMSKFNNM